MRLDFEVAQRKAFLRTDKLAYRCKLKIDEKNTRVIFIETLKEGGAGISSGGIDEFGPGFEFKTERPAIKGKKRESTIEQ